MSGVCEHGHQASKCEVCELRAALAAMTARVSNERLAQIHAERPHLIVRDDEFQRLAMDLTDARAALAVMTAERDALRILVMQILESEDFRTKNPSWSERADAALAVHAQRGGGENDAASGVEAHKPGRLEQATSDVAPERCSVMRGTPRDFAAAPALPNGVADARTGAPAQAATPPQHRRIATCWRCGMEYQRLDCGHASTSASRDEIGYHSACGGPIEPSWRKTCPWCGASWHRPEVKP